MFFISQCYETWGKLIALNVMLFLSLVGVVREALKGTGVMSKGIKGIRQG